MKFETIGNKENPVIIMINGSFTTGRPFLDFAAEYLADEFYVVCPTYSGHYDGGGTFDSRAGQASQIVKWLGQNGITRIALIQGLSMGAEVALELTKQLAYIESECATANSANEQSQRSSENVATTNKSRRSSQPTAAKDPITVNRILLDGGPFFSFPAPFRKFMYFKFRKIINLGKKGSTDRIMNSRLVKWIVHGDIEPYRNMIGDMSVDVITDETIRNETQACYTFDFPALSEQVQRKITFTWSEDEPAFKSAEKIREHYPYATYKNAGKMGHGGFILREPAKYAGIMKNLARVE